MTDLKKMYREIKGDPFPADIRISIGGTTLLYKKRTWKLEGQDLGLRYGENPDQPAALYELANGNLVLAGCEFIKPGKSLTSGLTVEDMIRFGKHPSKTNFTDVDNGLNILKYLMERPAALVMKHNNPSGVAYGASIQEAVDRAYHADRIAAMGGAVVVNRPCDKPTAELIAEKYVEVVAAPEYESGAVEILAARKNLRIIRIRNIEKLQEYCYSPILEFKSLMDGGLIVQQSQVNRIQDVADFLPAEAVKGGVTYKPERAPTKQELADLLFGWCVEQGVTSNSVLYVKNGMTVGIGTGEQDRVGVAEIAVFKAYKKYADMLVWRRHKISFYEFELGVERGKYDRAELAEINRLTEEAKGGIKGSVMISDAFFPFRDGADVGIKNGVTAIAHPGGSLNDHESIQACNEANPKVAMVFTGQRAFKH